MTGERPEPTGPPSIVAGARAPQRPRDDGSRSEQLNSEIEQKHKPSALDRENPADGPMQDRRKPGVAEPERPVHSSRTDDTRDQQGIETDNAIERPQERQPGQPGGKVD
ncbi:MAG: hypothetical protein AB7H66_10425 [Hyphomonadaceae bacterium]